MFFVCINQLASSVTVMQGDENVGVALLTYPVLMASDILLYQVILETCILSLIGAC